MLCLFQPPLAIKLDPPLVSLLSSSRTKQLCAELDFLIKQFELFKLIIQFTPIYIINKTNTLADPRGHVPPIKKIKDGHTEDKDNITEAFQCIFPYLKQRYFNVSGLFLIGLHDTSI